MLLPKIAITLGDVCGIGPEIVAKALCDDSVRRACQPVVIGPQGVMQQALARIKSALPIRPISDQRALADVQVEPNEVVLWDPDANPSLALLSPGAISGAAGAAAELFLRSAISAVQAGLLDGICTAPLHKAALALGGSQFPGHTEILADAAGVAQYAMMLYLPSSGEVPVPFGLGVAHVTLHTSIKSVPGLLSIDKVRETIELVDSFLRSLGAKQPRIGVCALNPHAGEEGLFGDEESQLISPAIMLASAQGIHARGPVPADALFRTAFNGQYDGIVAMYHDQGHIAFKLMGPEQAVNVTLGLPFVRTSPSHGTAFDIAGRGIARPDGMVSAIVLAARLAVKRT